MTFVIDTAEQLTSEIDALIAEIFPTAGRRPMYGGIVFEEDPGVPKSMVCGHFVYKAHVGLEFTNGYKLKDTGNVLEGSGKYRRHIKLRNRSDIVDKTVRAMLQQAFSNEAKTAVTAKKINVSP